MSKCPNVLVALLLLSLSSAAWPQRASSIDSNAAGSDGVTISLIDRQLTDERLELNYRIENRSGHDIWLCDAISEWGMDFETYVDVDRKTLVIRRRMGVRALVDWSMPPIGRYARLCAGESRREFLSLPVPVRLMGIFIVTVSDEKPVNASRLVVEIGYRDRDLFIEDNLFTFNEDLRDRDRFIRWEYDFDTRFERSVQFAVPDVSIPCRPEMYGSASQNPVAGIQAGAAGLGRFSRVEITYEPSMLDFFFSSWDRENLLNDEERQHLGQQKTVYVDDPKSIDVFLGQIVRCRPGPVVVTGTPTRVRCLLGDDIVASFTLYGRHRLMTDDGRGFRCEDEIDSLWTCTPLMRPFDLRDRCASNLKNLWRRLRIYHKAARLRLLHITGEPTYPPAGTWCDAIVTIWRREAREPEIMRPFKCPGAGEGRCHYAMNPNCRHDSPGDTVLLFETKAGWNQCGGPELFSVDSHDPRGGCVLLNDGTVKFVRTPEELRRLRWQ